MDIFVGHPIFFALKELEELERIAKSGKNLEPWYIPANIYLFKE